MAEKRSSTGAPRKVRAMLSSFITNLTRGGGTDEQKSISDSPNKSKTVNVSTPARDDTSKGTDEADAKATPTRRSFRPLSSEDFFHRLETFTVHTWFAMPSQLSPLRCARYGWENIESDTLKCVSCKELLYAGLPPQWETKKYEEACKKMEESLVTAHSKICPWPASPSPESFLDIPLADGKEVVETYCNRVFSMNGFGTRLPNLDLSSVTNETCDPNNISSRLQGLVKDHSGHDVDEDKSLDEEVQKASCLLALLGWQKSSTYTRCPVLECQYCRRSTGLWNFLSLEDNPADSTTTTTEDSEEQDSSETGEPQPKRIKQDSPKTKFNPITEHRTWCPWVQPSVSQSSDYPQGLITPTKNKTSDLGWQQLLAVLLRKADPHGNHGLLNKSTTPPSQAWKTVRRLLSLW